MTDTTPELGSRGTATLSRILDVAERLIAENGFDHTSMAEIATESGVAKPTLYYYFHSKDDIVEQILNRGISEFHEVIQSALAESSDVVEQIRQIVRGFLHIQDRSGDLNWQLVNQFGRRQGPLHDLWWENVGEMVQHLIETLVVRGQEAGLIGRELTPDCAGFTLYTMTMMFQYARYRSVFKDAIPTDPDELADLIVRLFLTGVQPSTH